MKTKTQKSQAGHPECVSKETAIAEAKKHREYADQDRKRAQKSLDGIEAQIASEKASAAMALWSAAKHDELADAYLEHAESIVPGKIGY